MRLSHAMALDGSSDPASDAMIALGGEAAAALGGEGHLAGLLVLGPKRSGMPYEDEEMAFLGRSSSVATLVLHSADIQQTLESLNQELRGKVDKIAEQQRRILILQDQLQDRAERERELTGGQPARGTAEHRALEASGDARPRALRDDQGLERGRAQDDRDGPQGRRHALGRADPRRKRHRQGAAGRGDPSGQPACCRDRSSSSTARRFRRACSKASCSVTSRVPSPGPTAIASVDSNRPTAARLFLDEIGDINLEVQTKLLRVLQEMSFERVGSSQSITVDVRILAATHQDLEALIRAGRFREDLYYRLNVIYLTTPASARAPRGHLRARRLLPEPSRRAHRQAGHAPGPRGRRSAGGLRLARKHPRAREHARAGRRARRRTERDARRPSARAAPARPSAAASADLGGVSSGRGRSWRASRVAPAKSSALPGPIAGSAGGSSARESAPPGEDWNAEFVAYERQRLIDALNEAGGNKSVAARLLGMPRSTFFSKMKKHGVV